MLIWIYHFKMITNVPTYEYDLGDNLSLVAYSLEANIGEKDLEGMISAKDGTGERVDLERLSRDMPIVGQFESLGGLEINILDEEYVIPQQLAEYRRVMGETLERKGGFNGPIMVVKGDVQVPLTIINGGYFDFKATKLDSSPGELMAGYPPKKNNKKIVA